MKQRKSSTLVKLGNLYFNVEDILHLQEVSFSDDTFEDCLFLCSRYNFLTNNSVTGYGTATLIRNSIEWENHQKDTDGRVQLFDISGFTFGNIYHQSGLENTARRNREILFSVTIPTLLINSKVNGVISGDWNCIARASDATNNPAQKVSPSMKNLIRTFNWTDTCVQLNIKNQFTRFYSTNDITHASRLDRTYTFGTVSSTCCNTIALPFSDHLAVINIVSLGEDVLPVVPRVRPLFKSTPWVILDPDFKAKLEHQLQI